MQSVGGKKLKTKWILRWETVHPFYRMEAFFLGHKARLVLGGDYINLMGVYTDGVMQMHYSEEDLQRKASEALDILNDKEKVFSYLEATKNNYRELITGIKDLSSKQKKLSNTELYKEYERIFEKLQYLQCSYDLSRPEFFEEVDKRLKSQIAKVYKEKTQKIYAELTTSTKTTFLDREKADWVRLVNEAKGYHSFIVPEVSKLLGNHQRKYGWIGTSESSREWNVDYYLERLRNDISTTVEHKSRNKKHLEEKQRLLEKKLDDDTKHLLWVVREFAHLRLKIRLKWVESGSLLKHVFEEIKRRTNECSDKLTQYKLDEIRDLLIQNKFVPDKVLEARKNSVFKLSGVDLRLYEGDDALNIKASELCEENYSGVKELKGMTANPGKIIAEVKIINALSQDQDKEISRMREGAILVTGMTRPHLMLAIKKAVGIITDEGGITSHASIVSREFDIPCVVGTKHATKVLKDGDRVELDANKGIIRLIE